MQERNDILHYAISDIHGCYDKYISMLEKIGFNDGDTLYFLGDAVDRGPDGVKILLDMMARKNVVPLLGNHEDTFYVMINSLRRNLSDEEQIGVEAEKFAWLECDGGQFTWDAYCALPEETKKNLFRYLETFELYDKIRVNGRTFLLSHAGLGDYAPGKTLADCTADDLLWGRMDYERVYCPGTYIVSGHTPTGYIDPACAGKIIRKNNHIAIDCGAVFGGALGCICLETLEEFYS